MEFKNLLESVKKLDDKKIDSFIKKHWDGKTITYFYNGDSEYPQEFGIGMDAIVSKDRKSMHVGQAKITGKPSDINKIIKKYNLKEIT